MNPLLWECFDRAGVALFRRRHSEAQQAFGAVGTVLEKSREP
jgi:hypothetical protein